MNLSDITQLAQQATEHLRPELLLLAGKAAEATASESGKQLVTWLRDRLKGNAAKAALKDATTHPESDRRVQALQTQIEILLEENESFRQELGALLADTRKRETPQQNVVTHGSNNKTGVASGHDIKIRIG